MAHPLAVQASRLLGYPVAISHEVFPLPLGADLLDMVGRAIGVGEIVRRLRLKRAWGLRSKHGAVGIVCEGEPVVAIQGIEIYPLEDGYLVLIVAVVVRLANTHLGKEGTV